MEIQYLSTSSDSEDEVTVSPQNINLDANAGLLQKYDQLETQFNIGNIHGNTERARDIQTVVEQARKELCNVMKFNNVFYIPSASYMIDVLRPYKPYPFPHQHPSVDWSGSDNRYMCLINLVRSDTGEIQNFEKATNFRFIVIDATQAIGRIDICSQQASCVFFSCHKFGGFGAFVFMTDEFYDQIIESHHPKIEYKTIDNKFLSWPSFHFNAVLFMTDFKLTLAELKKKQRTQRTYNRVMKILQNQGFEIIQPEQPHCYCSISFTGKLCQNELSKRGVVIGFSTACQSFNNQVMRVSWREEIPTEQLDYLEIVLKQCSSISGGSKAESAPYMYELNHGQFWLHGHWVDNHNDKNLNAKIPSKYGVIFQDYILNSNVVLGVKIPQYPDQRRVAKNVYINPEDEEIVEAWLTPKMFDDPKKLLPDIVTQNFEDRMMTRKMFDFIERNGLDINHEYSQRGCGIPEIVTKIKVPFVELLVSACNSYYNYKSDYKGEAVRYKDTYDVKGKELYVIRPCCKMMEVKKALEICEDLKKHKHPFVLILYDKPPKQLDYKRIHGIQSTFKVFQYYWSPDADVQVYCYDCGFS